MNSLLIFGFSLLALGSCFPHSKEILEQDKEVILEANRNLEKLEESMYQFTNATMNDLYRSIVDHNIADESIIQEAKDYLNKWENVTGRYPPFSYFLRLEELKDPEDADKWNLWTAGLLEKKIAQMVEITEQARAQRDEILRTELSNVSDWTKSLLMIEQEDQPGTPNLGNQYTPNWYTYEA